VDNVGLGAKTVWTMITVKSVSEGIGQMSMFVTCAQLIVCYAGHLLIAILADLVGGLTRQASQFQHV